MPISCHFRDCKALLVTSSCISSATASIRPLPFLPLAAAAAKQVLRISCNAVTLQAIRFLTDSGQMCSSGFDVYKYFRRKKNWWDGVKEEVKSFGPGSKQNQQAHCVTQVQLRNGMCVCCKLVYQRKT